MKFVVRLQGSLRTDPAPLGVFGGSAGSVLHSQVGSGEEELSRCCARGLGDRLQCSFRPGPAAAGCGCDVGGDGGFESWVGLRGMGPALAGMFWRLRLWRSARMGAFGLVGAGWGNKVSDHEDSPVCSPFVPGMGLGNCGCFWGGLAGRCFGGWGDEWDSLVVSAVAVSPRA